MGDLEIMEMFLFEPRGKRRRHAELLTAGSSAAAWCMLGDSEVIYRNGDGHVIKFNLLTNETEVILTNATFVNFNVAKYSVSPDLKYVLFAYDVKQSQSGGIPCETVHRDSI
ncbi:Inactive dipeptidyl peptidase 10 [Takifugu flavidus]|uniref:Inactive dipeptidyl peptidase 10 n=1 Tax=Takifugu flavidus TaxID=433684 RepID=A0A5C6PNJ2_9TELE|nr:Inactive dipeptidyl peptidase 10 [Takifugu flavidus]